MIDNVGLMRYVYINPNMVYREIYFKNMLLFTMNLFHKVGNVWHSGISDLLMHGHCEIDFHQLPTGWGFFHDHMFHTNISFKNV